MRFSKAGAALAIVFAVSVFSGHTAYADDSQEIVIARDPSHAQEVTVKPSITDVTVQPGDNLSAIATKYQTTVDEIVRLNALTDPNVISEGIVLHVPQSDVVVEENSESYDQLRAAASAFITPPAPVVRVTPATQSTRSSMTSYGGSTSYNTGNGMWCTDYVHSRRPDVPIYGNAGYNWISAAQSQGRATGTIPQAGAIAVMNGHVAYVESVNGDGSYVVSEMGWNYKPGSFNQRTVGPGAFGGFIY